MPEQSFDLSENIIIAPELSEYNFDVAPKELVKSLPSREITLSREQYDEIMKSLDKISTELKSNDKKAKKLPKLTPALLVSLGIRFPLFILWCYQWSNFKEAALKADKGLADAIGEGLKLSALGWIISEPIKDHTKPYYEYYRDAFDTYVNEFFLGAEKKKNDAAIA